MTTPRGSLVWLAMVVAGLSLGAYVVVAWPGSAPATVPSTVRATAAVASSESELAGAFYPSMFYGYSFEPGTTPALDAVISAPQPLGAG